MELRNRRGTPVDPVPFLVVVLLTGLVAFAFGPLYAQALGFTVREGLLGCSAVTLAVTGVAYYTMIYTARPELWAEIPAAYRMQRIVYLLVVLILLVAILALPLL